MRSTPCRDANRLLGPRRGGVTVSAEESTRRGGEAAPWERVACTVHRRAKAHGDNDRANESAAERRARGMKLGAYSKVTIVSKRNRASTHWLNTLNAAVSRSRC